MTNRSLRNPHLYMYLPTSGGAQDFLNPLLSALNRSGEVPLAHIRTLAFEGIPEDVPNLRALVYRLLLGYLPTNVALWSTELRKHRENYSLLRKELMAKEDPWDHKVWTDIEKDIRRTRTDEKLFFEPVDPTITVGDVLTGRKPVVPYKPLFPSLYSDSDDLPPSCSDYVRLILSNPEIEKHIDVMARILYIYAKLNPGVKYVQGMNEVLAPLYYLFVRDDSELFAGYAEEDAFYCFTALMAEMRDNFVRSLDLDQLGLTGRMRSIIEILARLSPELSAHLVSLRILPVYYAIKWVTLLFTQNFPLSALFRLWDSLLSDEYRFNFFLYTCVAVLELNKAAILQGDFASVMGVLQKPIHFSVSEMLECAVALMQQDEAMEE